MHIKRAGDRLTMSETLVCTNYGDMQHHVGAFEKIDDNRFRCTTCAAVATVSEPVIVFDDKGRLKMQVAVEFQGG